MAMFRSIFNKLRGKSADKKDKADSGARTAEDDAAAGAAGVDTDTSVIPLGVTPTRKSVVSAPLPIPSLVNDPLTEDELEDGDAESADGTINPIAAASAAAHDAGLEIETEAAGDAELDTDADFDAFEGEPAPPAEPAVELLDDELVISAEALCGIDPESMDREQIRSRLAILYRRHNAAASSLNAELRVEAEQMLDAIVACREAYVDHL